jgi:hypothetical protein
MKKKLYYTVNKYTEFINEIEECTGTKEISVYQMVNNEPIEVFCIDCYNEQNTIEEIKEWFVEHDRDIDFELVQL